MSRGEVRGVCEWGEEKWGVASDVDESHEGKILSFQLPLLPFKLVTKVRKKRGNF